MMFVPDSTGNIVYNHYRLMKMGRRTKHNEVKKQAKEIAQDSINNLFALAKKSTGKDTKLADRYVDMARRIAMKAKTRIPSACKRQYCKHCYSYLMPGRNCRVRMNNKTISYYCEKCKRFSRIGYKAKKAKQKVK